MDLTDTLSTKHDTSANAQLKTHAWHNFITHCLPETHSLSSHKSPLALDKHAPWEHYVHVQCLKMQEEKCPFIYSVAM